MLNIVLIALFSGSCLAYPQHGGQSVVNPNVRILNFESFQNGADFGHSLQQEDGTSSGQKIGPDGLIYGFYSYIQQGGTPVRVYYRAGQGVGYEVLKVEGLNEKGLGNLRATISDTPYVEPPPKPAAPRAPVVHNVQPAAPRAPVVHNVQPAAPRALPHTPVHHVQPAVPVMPVKSVVEEPTPAPHRFDYPVNFSMRRTGAGFRSSFKAL